MAGIPGWPDTVAVVSRRERDRSYDRQPEPTIARQLSGPTPEAADTRHMSPGEMAKALNERKIEPVADERPAATRNSRFAHAERNMRKERNGPSLF